MMPDVHFTLETLIAEGDKVAAHWTMKSTYKLKNIPVTSTGMIISRIVNGKCGEDWEIFDRHWINEQGATGWIEKRMMSTITKKMKKALPFLSLST
jgi:predicted ester cyclase